MGPRILPRKYANIVFVERYKFVLVKTSDCFQAQFSIPYILHTIITALPIKITGK